MKTRVFKSVHSGAKSNPGAFPEHVDGAIPAVDPFQVRCICSYVRGTLKPLTEFFRGVFVFIPGQILLDRIPGSPNVQSHYNGNSRKPGKFYFETDQQPDHNSQENTQPGRAGITEIQSQQGNKHEPKQDELQKRCVFPGKIKGKDQRHDQCYQSSVNGMILEERPHYPMTFFFTETVGCMHNQCVSDRYDHRGKEEPQEPADFLRFIEYGTSIKQYRDNEPQTGQKEFKGRTHIFACDRGKEYPKQVEYYRPDNV
ncbi:hypothetical protein D3C86_1413900 [compost metagenome]